MRSSSHTTAARYKFPLARTSELLPRGGTPLRVPTPIAQPHLERRHVLARQRRIVDGALRVVDVEGAAARRQRLGYIEEGVPKEAWPVEGQGYLSSSG